MRYNTIFFDLDDTLYPTTSGLWTAIRERIDLYMTQRLGLSPLEVPALRQQLFRQYGTTMRGLQQTRHVDATDYLAFVHDVPVADYLSPSPSLDQMLSTINQKKIIFTNADAAHALRVLAALGVRNPFERIIDILSISPYCKPQAEAFSRALTLAGGVDPSTCILVDDGPQNLATARQMGFYTVGVNDAHELPEAHTTITTILDLPIVLNGRLQ